MEELMNFKELTKNVQWNGSLVVSGIQYSSIEEVPQDLMIDNNQTILFKPKENVRDSQAATASTQEYRVSVRQYMTKKATPSFDFMAKWNNDVPMPLMTMVGTIEKETKGMYKMRLHADTTFTEVQHCMKCGKLITNPVSKFFGMGPECGGHNYVNPFNSQEELNNAVNAYKKEVLSKIEWEGWVIRSAITRMEEI
jgi:hypothetical protein